MPNPILRSPIPSDILSLPSNRNRISTTRWPWQYQANGVLDEIDSSQQSVNASGGESASLQFAYQAAIPFTLSFEYSLEGGELGVAVIINDNTVFFDFGTGSISGTEVIEIPASVNVSDVEFSGGAEFLSPTVFLEISGLNP